MRRAAPDEALPREPARDSAGRERPASRAATAERSFERRIDDVFEWVPRHRSG